MRSGNRVAWCIVASCLCLSAALAQNSPTVHIGEPAPVIGSPKWLKGQPVHEFGKGQIYVVDFWATWCGPCRAAFPHINEIARHYKDKVSVIAVNVREGEGDQKPLSFPNLQKRVADFVQSMGDKMSFNVCMDKEDTATFKNWMTASGMHGIPTTFIVDQQGRIAWIGHPGPDDKTLDQVIEQLSSGIFDYKAAATNFQSDAQQDAERRELNRIRIAAKAKQYAKALTMLDGYCSSHAGAAARVKSERVLLLAHIDPAKSIETAHDLAGDDLVIIASALVRESGVHKSVYAFAISVLEKEIAASSDAQPEILGALAEGYFRLGKTKEAVGTQRRLIEWAKANSIPRAGIVELSRTLKMYQGGK